uniref:FERM domain-containing protein n=1 Tax=Parastrongyloides trichosuri TaxID=131310 RepID=A0A0N5A3R5_PARTI
MSEKGRRAEVILINGFKFEIILTKKLKVEELIVLAGNQCQIYEPDLKYFGIAYVNEKDHYIWLKRDKKVIDCGLPSNWYRNENIINQDILLQFHFAVKYFVSSFTYLLNPSSIIMLFLETKSLFLKGYLELQVEKYPLMYALILQYYRGDYVSQNMYSVLSLSMYFPKNILTKMHMTAEEFRIQIGIEYQKLVGMSKGEASVEFLSIAEKSHAYGSRLYQVKDKNNTSYLLAINNRGIYQYTNDLQFKLKRIFHWKNLDNFHYLDQHFSIEVETNTNNHYMEDINSDNRSIISEKNEIGHDITLSSITRNSMASAMVIKQKFNFFCESSSLCRVLWDAAVSQHQFYLDQLSNVKSQTLVKHYAEFDKNLESDLKRIAEKINSVLINNSLTPFANNESGSKMSTQSLMSNLTASPSIDLDSVSEIHKLGFQNEEKSLQLEDEKSKKLRKYRALRDKKNKLEELLLKKLDELKEICINEAELTGELPKEIYRTLAPGEPEPKIKKRVGTAFKLSNNILNNANKDDTVNKLEMEIDLQRKIVDAAGRLASDKTTNKSVRKKRRRDFEAANQKLRGLEKGLQKIYLARSKPELSFVDGNNRTKYNSHAWPNYVGMPRSSISLKSLISKSCPTTPRGSFNDLSYYPEKMNFDNKTSKVTNSISNISENINNSPQNSSYNSNYNYSNYSPDTLRNNEIKNNISPSIPTRRANSIVSMKRNNISGGSLFENEKQDEQSKSYHDIYSLPIYANIGYHTSAPYISSYRQSHYPTLFDQQIARNNRESRSNSMTPVNTNNPTSTNASVAAAASTQMGLIVKQISQSSLMNGPYTTPSNPQYHSLYPNMSIGDHHSPSKQTGNSISTYNNKIESNGRLPMKDSNSSIKKPSSLLLNHRKVTTFPASCERIGSYKIAPENSTLTKNDKQYSIQKDDWNKNIPQSHNLNNQRLETLLIPYRTENINKSNRQDDMLNKNSTATIV